MTDNPAQMADEVRTMLSRRDHSARLTAAGIRAEVRESAHYGGGWYVRIYEAADSRWSGSAPASILRGRTLTSSRKCTGRHRESRRRSLASASGIASRSTANNPRWPTTYTTSGRWGPTPDLARRQTPPAAAVSALSKVARAGGAAEVCRWTAWLMDLSVLFR
jgi:hypothetical protein